jgi:hypothetical protein
MNSNLQSYLNSSISSAPLAVFRIGFGLMMCYGMIRFWAHGWIESLYIEPSFHFSYYGFEWIKPLGHVTYFLFTTCGLAALFVALGYKYRIAIIIFFLSFTYIELMDKTTYLNHYYFISVLSFLMIFLPAHKRFSVDSYASAKAYATTPRWTLDSIKLLLATVYFYAGLAKLNSDWLLRAMPLKIWLPSKYDLPILGDLLQLSWMPHAFSWSGMLYDLFIPFLLIYKRTRWLAFGLVVIFHVLTRILFPIGMFPFVMIVSAMVFLDSSVHERILSFLKKRIGFMHTYFPKKEITPTSYNGGEQPAAAIAVVSFILFLQLAIPFRYLFYPGTLYWTEQGYRFSWRVMLMEKMGNAQFKIVNKETGKSFYVNNTDFLTPFQEKQMSFQPDFILQYAHYLGDHFAAQGHKNVQVFVDANVALNGRLSQPFIDTKTDLYQVKESFQHKNWILPFHDDPK